MKVLIAFASANGSTGRRWAAATAVVAYGTLQWLGRAYGATPGERRRAFPGDELIDSPDLVTTHGITVHAPASDIWPWLAQVGWHRGGWYTSWWVDRLLFPANAPAAERLLDGIDEPVVGDAIPDGPPETECVFLVTDVEHERHLVLRSTSHLPESWRRRWGVDLDFTWAFVVDPLPLGRSRFLFRTRVRMAPWWARTVYRLLLVPADFVMSRQMLRGVRRRAEGMRSDGEVGGGSRGGSDQDRRAASTTSRRSATATARRAASTASGVTEMESIP